MEDPPLKLMIPGPVQPDDDVLEAMGSPVQAHYGPAFTKLYHETVDLLKPIFGTQGDVFLLVGSGTAGIDACLGSALSTGEKIIVGMNGFFGQRLKSVAEGYGLVVIPVKEKWGIPLHTGDIETALDLNPDVKAVTLVHLETSTAVVNPIEAVGQLTRDRGISLIVDAVSSLGGLPLQMDSWGVDFCASATQKCLGTPPGLSPVAVGTQGWKAVERNPNKAHGWYSNLSNWRRYATNWAGWHPFPVTMATNNVAALRIALIELMKEGIETRLARFRGLALHLREGLRQIEMPPFTPDEILAPVLTTAYGPPGVPTSRIVDYLAATANIKIGGGLGELNDKVFRIGHMSPKTARADIDEVLAALKSFKDNMT